MLSESAVSDVGAPPWEAAPPAAPDGFELHTEDVFGAWIVEQLLARYSGNEEAAALAREWRGDRWYLFVSETGSVAVAWQLAFIAEDAANQFVDVLTAAFGGRAGWAASHVGTGAVIAAADDPATLTAWDTALTDPWAQAPESTSDQVDTAANSSSARLIPVLRRLIEF
jgi:hypothetical protein